MCIAILDPAHGTQTELNEVGPEISADELQRFRLSFEGRVQGMEFVVLSGSTPPGVPDSIYAELIEVARHYNVRSVLDTSGAPLAEALAVCPFMAKPNVRELSDVVGCQLATVEETAEAASRLNREGIEIMVVTLGQDGSLACAHGEIWSAKPPRIEFLSAVGSGDAFAAAFVYALMQEHSVQEALRLGTAAGAANAMSFGAGYCKREDIYRLARQVEVAQLTGAV